MMPKITIEGEIGYEVTKQSVIAQLDEADGKDITLRISSLGGSVDDALSIHDALKGYPGNVVANIDGMVASAATIIAMGAKEIRMSENAFFLIHKSMSMIGIFSSMNEDDIDELITDLKNIKATNEKIDAVIANIYSKRTGRRPHTILNLMKEDRWLNANEAHEFGFVDEVTSPSKMNRVQMLGLAASAKEKKLPELPKEFINQNKETMNVSELKEWVASKIEEITTPKTEKVEVKIMDNEEVQAKLAEVEGLIASKEEELAGKAGEIEAKVAEVETLTAKVTELEAEIEKMKAVETKTEAKADDGKVNDESKEAKEDENSPFAFIAKRFNSMKTY